MDLVSVSNLNQIRLLIRGKKFLYHFTTTPNKKIEFYPFFFTDFRNLKACFENLFFDVVQNKVENSFRHVFQDLISLISIKAGDLARNVTGSAKPGFSPSVCNKICATFKTLRMILNVITARLRCCMRRHELNGSFDSKKKHRKCCYRIVTSCAAELPTGLIAKPEPGPSPTLFMMPDLGPKDTFTD